jgi:hypothetical protein
MVVQSLEFVVVYLTVGLIICFFTRKGWPEDWDETLLASLLGPLLLALTAAAVAADLLRARLIGGSGSRTSTA